MNHPLQCQCGKVKGQVSRGGLGLRAICYCKDCQAFAQFLGRADAVLDAQGGTEIVAAFPSQVQLTQGVDSIACMSLAPRGLLRWYAACCNTPLGNTPRNSKTPYIGLVHSCLEQGPLEESFGPVGSKLNTASATGPVQSTPGKNLTTLLKLIRALIGGRIAGRSKPHPFFPSGTDTPLKSPRILTPTERARLPGAAPHR